MKNPAKVALLLIFLLLLIVIFFAYTGINVRKPTQAMYILVDKVIELNRAINRFFEELILTIRAWFQETFAR